MGDLNSSSDLPPSDSPALKLVQPTEEEKVAQATSNSSSWRGALPVETYLRREAVLEKTPFTQDGGMTFWVLIDKEGKDRKVLAGCETTRKKALVWRNGKLEDVLCHGIASVWCPPDKRKRGYAGRMMKELGQALGGWQGEEKEVLFTVLFSDIGKDFYAQHGWEPFNSAHISVPASPELVEGPIDLKALPKTFPIYSADLPNLCDIDEKLLRKTMSSASGRDKTLVAIVPTLEQVDWHHTREDFVAQELHGKTPDIKGAMISTEKGKSIWCYWTRMFYNEDPQQSKGNTLHILRIVIEQKDVFLSEKSGAAQEGIEFVPAIAALFLAAMEQAREWHMENVEVWNPTTATIRAAQLVWPEANVVHRDKESVASLKWHGEAPAGLKCGKKVGDVVEWVGNEKYGWC